MFSRLALAVFFLTGALTAAVSHYFTTTYAGFTPPYPSPVATQLFFPSIPAIAYDASGKLYWAVGSPHSVEIRSLNADGTDPIFNTVSLPQPLQNVTNILFDAQGNLLVGVALASGFNIYRVTPTSVATAVTSKDILLAFTVDPAGNFYTNEFQDTVISDIFLYPPNGGAGTMLVNGDSVPSSPPYGILGTANAMVYSGSSLYFFNGNYLFQCNVATHAVTLLDQVTISASSLIQNGTVAPVPSSDGTLYVSYNNRIFQFHPPKSFTPIAGSGVTGSSADPSPASQATISPQSIALNPVTQDIAFADSITGTIRVMKAATNTIQTVAGTSHFFGDNGPAITSYLQASNLSADSAGNLYLFDNLSARIRKIDTHGVITTLAGNGIQASTGDNGKAAQASISGYNGGIITSDKSGNIYFQGGDARVRKIDTAGNITTIAGGGTGTLAPTAQATLVSLIVPSGLPYPATTGPACLTTDASGNVYIGILRRIWKVDPAGRLSVYAGTGTPGNPIDGTLAVNSSFGTVASMVFDAFGDLYFSDFDKSVIRKISAQGTISLVAGIPTNMFPQSPVSAGPAKTANLGTNLALTIDASGNLYFFSSGFYRQILLLDPSGNLTPIAGQTSNSAYSSTPTGDGGDALQANFGNVTSMTVDAGGNVTVLDGAVVRRLSPYQTSAPPPFLGQGGVVGAAGSIPAVAWVSPGGIATLFGANFIKTAHGVQTSDLVNGQLPTNLVGVCASFGSTPAALLGVYPSQLNVQVPNVAPGPYAVEVTLNCGTSSAITSNLSGVMVQSASPEFFSFLPDPVNGNPVAAYNAATGVAVGPPGLIAGLNLGAAHAGDIVEAYGTGWGGTSPPFATGVIPGAAAMLASPFTLSLGGVPVPAGNVAYIGVAPCCAGLYQIDFTVPSGVPAGNAPLILNITGWLSPATAYLATQ